MIGLELNVILMKTSYKGMLILSVYYPLVLPIMFMGWYIISINCIDIS